MTGSTDAQDDGHRVPLSPDAVVSFELILRYPPSNQAAIEEESRQLMAGARSPARAAAITNRSADPADIDRVCAFLTHAGLTVDAVEPATRAIRVSGGAAIVAKLFGIAFMQREGDASWREYRGQLRMPTELSGIVLSALGLSTKPIA